MQSSKKDCQKGMITGMNTDMEWKDGIRFQVRENRAALICGGLAIGFALFILIMRLRYPSGRGGGAVLYLPLVCMTLFGVMCLVTYFCRRLIVEEMNICYVNSFGKRTQFALDDIGFCKIGAGGARSKMVLYDLLGDKLCKLEIDMCGFPELHQYLLDNRIEVEWSRMRPDSEAARVLEALRKETAVCGEEIRKCSQAFYRETESLFREWEKRNQKLHVSWELGFAEYAAADVAQKCRSMMRTSSLENPLQDIPDTYECLLEAYLKCDGAYVVDSRGEEVSLILPYLVKSRSYQIGEGTRIRRSDEQSMKEWLSGRLETLARELPRHKYHTEALILQHQLRQEAGIAAKEYKE